MNKRKIPKSFSLFANKIDVIVNDEKCRDSNAYGFFDYSTSTITIAKNDGLDKISKDRRIETFYHERTHAILCAMNEFELSSNEKFVDIFSKLLKQADETEE